MSPTIYDIAKEAGVSIATVSRVFSNNTSVSEKNRKKVLEVAEKVGYHPQGFARGLAGKKNNLITAIVPIISNYFFMEVLAGIQDKVIELGYDLNIYNVTSAKGSMLEQVEHVLRKRMSDGYLLVSVHMSKDKWQKLKRYDVPITLVDEYYSDLDSVSVNSSEGAYKATKYFIKQGYKHIAFISALANSKPVRERTRGYLKALSEADLPKNIVQSDLANRDGFTEKGGYDSMEKLLNKSPAPDAILCSSDIQALGALKAMKHNKVSIPIISFDDIEMAEYLGLSTMRQPMYDMGYMATQKLIERIRNNKRNVSHTVFSPELVIRSSSESEKIKEQANS